MNEAKRIKLLSPPVDSVDAVLDTDAYNEIDDQFAISYLLKSRDRINVKAICAAPFYNSRAKSPADGMEKSYDEILRLLSLMGEEHPVLRGSECFMADEQTPVDSPAARRMAELCMEYSAQQPLYVVAIGAITNVASALLLNPEMKERVVVVWLGGHAQHFHDTKEFNMKQDVAAARVVMNSGVPLVQLPCFGVVDSFRISRPELEYWLKGKGALADYLVDSAVTEAESYAKGKPWTRVIWGVAAVAWLLNDKGRFLLSRLVPTPLPTYDHLYAPRAAAPVMAYVYHVKRDALMEDLIRKLIQ